MKILKKLKNRYNIMAIVLFLMMFALVFKLSILTIVKGDDYREESDTKRIKEVSQTAPRGEIRDRNGILLAGSNPSFTVHLLKDEIANIDSEDKLNDLLLSLFRLIEEDGAYYEDEFPVEFNTFKYSDETGLEEVSAQDRVVEIIKEKELIRDILDTYYVSDEYSEHFKYVTVNKIINSLEMKGIKMPVITELTSEGINIYFDTNKHLDDWRKTYGIAPNAGARDAILKLVGNDENIIRKLMNHGVSREIIYRLLVDKGLDENIVLEDISIKYDRQYDRQKKKLASEFDFITMETEAKDDFINLVLETSIEDLLLKVNQDKLGNIKAPGLVLFEIAEKKDLDLAVEAKVDKDSLSIYYEYKKGREVKGQDPINYLVDFSKKNKLIEDFITSDEVKSDAQSALLENGYNPRISIKEWEYISMAEKHNLLKRFKVPLENTKKSVDKYNVNPLELFEYITDYYSINPNLSKHEIRGIVSLYDQISKQGYRAYEPIKIAYGISPQTFAKIEEGFMHIPAVDVSVEPIRYYPNGEHAAHIIGYLGKISQDSEIEKYVKERNYSKNDIIGKTGVEESFEEDLRGKNGKKTVQIDVLGNTTKVLKEEKPVPGNNLYLTIDSKVQKVAEDSLKHGLEEIRRGGVFKSSWGDYQFGINTKKGRPFKNATSGSVVVTNVKTGELIALANYPAYNPNLFSTGISSTDWNSLFPDDERDLLAPRPLYNIAMQTGIQPGSTFKMITGLAGLEKGFSPTKTIRDMGKVDIGTTTMGCWIWNSFGGTHGPVNIYTALRDSCNYYFYSLALGKNQKTGESLGVQVSIDDLADMAKKLGMDDKSGIEINVPNEFSGGVPGPLKKTITTKALLRRELRRDLEVYIDEEVILSEDAREEKIEEIISILDSQERLTKADIIKKLRDMGINGENKKEGAREDLGDRIAFTYFPEARWSIADTLNITIGQGTNSYTPLQMSRAISTLVNGGYKHDLTLVDKITSYDSKDVVYDHRPDPERIELNNYENLEHIKKGMRLVASEGTSRRTFGSFPVAVGAKTGTAQREGRNPVTGDSYDDYSWFVAYGPYEDPEIAVSVVLFQGGGGGNASPIAREVMAEYFKLNEPREKTVENEIDEKEEQAE